MKKLSLSFKEFILCCVLLILHCTLFGQLSVKGTPVGLIPEIQARLSSPVFVQMEAVNVDALIEEDRILDNVSDIPYRFGENLYVDLNPKNSGIWDTLDDGSRLWRLGIISKNAISINLAFNRYLLPKGATLFVYTPDGEEVIGAFTELNNQDDGYFATTLVNGDMIIIEYYEPYWAEFPGELNLWRVTHGYRGPGALLTKGFGSSGSCNVNVACPEGQCWDHQVRSVGMLVVGGNGFCSGFLINNTRNNAVPYFLSANHCFENPSTVVFWFNWESPTCDNPQQVPPHDAMSGAVTKAQWATTDFWLLRLNQSIPGSYNVYYSGWNRTTQSSITGTVTGIHHPKGDIKKISWANGGVTRSVLGGAPYSGYTFWRTDSWSNQTTIEKGSSGSPLYDPQGYAIGQLWGGYLGCGNNGPAYYGRIGTSWTGGGTDATRLKNWLDPDNTYINPMHGYDPNMDITGPSIVCTSNSTFTLTSPPPGSVTWSFSPALVTPSSGSGTSATFHGTSCSYIGEGTLTFTINRSGCFPLQMTKRNIVVNGPEYSDVELDVYYSTGQPAPKAGGTWLLCPNTHYHIYLVNNSSCQTSNYNWTIPSGWSLNYQYNNMISIYTNASPGGNVIVKAQTCCADCGSSVTINSTYFGTYYNCGYGFSMYPNPTSDAITIIINEGVFSNIKVTNKVSDQVNYTIRFYNKLGALVLAEKRMGNSFNIPLPELSEGTYIVEVSDGNISYRENLIIKHE